VNYNKSADMKFKATNIKYEIHAEKVNKTINLFRKDLEIFKSNLIASGQSPPSFTLADGNRLTLVVNKL